jgi:hypothetical protein
MGGGLGLTYLDAHDGLSEGAGSVGRHLNTPPKAKGGLVSQREAQTLHGGLSAGDWPVEGEENGTKRREPGAVVSRGHSALENEQ